MSAVSRLEITNVYADDSTAKVTVTNIRPENIQGGNHIERIRNAIMQFNAVKGGELATKMKSKNGFNWVGIKRARILTTDTNYIF